MSLNHLSPVNQLSHYLAAITGNYSVTIYLFPSNCKEVACHCRPTFALVICVHIFCLQILSHLKVFCGKTMPTFYAEKCATFEILEMTVSPPE